MSDVTQILSQIESRNRQAAEQLLPLVYDELRKLAAARLVKEKPGQTLQATALVHEAYMRLVARLPVGKPAVELDPNAGHGGPTADQRPPSHAFNSRGHFFAAAAEAMRRILIDRARTKQSGKRGGGWKRQPLENVEIEAPESIADLLAVNELLERFEQLDQVAAGVVKLRYFAGLTIPQAAEALGISTSTADRHWAYARAWLHAELKKNDS